ncbi:MAG: hypothetical protein ACOYI8_03955 [Christensenellales bacterium]|jgi:hypothetical protein
MKRILIALLVCAVCFACGAFAEEQGSPLKLRVFVYDRCGGCGADGPGCGDCDEVWRLHAIVKGALGDRLYDGSLEYTMPNCRMLLLLDEYEQYCDTYGVYDDLYGLFPAAFVLREDGSGVFAVGEGLLASIDVVIDAFERGDSAEDIQAQIDALYAELKDENVSTSP